MSDKVQDILIRSVSQLRELLGSGPPEHPLISVIRQDDRPTVVLDRPVRFRTDFYIVMMKRNITSKVRYGQQYYDFNEGLLATMAPGQVFRVDGDHDGATGWLLVFHPDLIRSYPLAKAISNYGFFPTK